jgi:hypothetical protein
LHLSLDFCNTLILPYLLDSSALWSVFGGYKSHTITFVLENVMNFEFFTSGAPVPSHLLLLLLPTPKVGGGM